MLRRTWLVFSQAVTVALALLFVVSTLKPEWLESVRGRAPLPAPTIIEAAPPAASAARPARPGYSAAARRAAPAVVSIAASKVPPQVRPEDPAFRFFFGGRPPPGRSQIGLGSAVIVSPEGYLLTNAHVVEGADEIEVQLADGRSGAARLIGADPETDLAVLKVDLDRLPVIAFGDSEQLSVGDVVLAIGNPFNVGQTVTSGIVSALGRNRLGLSTFEHFIQTDAPINPGNSGGALVDAEGNLVGINTAIFSRSGGSLGIGFAIPADIARQVMAGIVRDGRVTRGWIGVESRDLTPELAESFGLAGTSGALITGVLQDGPASRGGVQPGDVVTRVGATGVGSTAQLLAAVAALEPRSEARLGLQRRGQAIEVRLIVAQRPPVQRAPAR